MRWTRSLFIFLTVVSGATTAKNDQKVSSEAAVKSISELPPAAQPEAIRNIKSATDGLQVAIQSVSTQDVAKVLKGVGDVLAELPGGFGYAGVAFSLAASVFTLGQFATFANSDGSLRKSSSDSLNLLGD